ncbi:neutral zinc metallopeptidase [Sphingomonas bacterium]|uniref:KPN_02809 family neutral zinc metallopeptidase n=1 Tax=Sphingomonas bacterium TaxID=1895847 RepID=UPI0026125DD9|nr:neutral zinc metallopeptidase [Sphingomonas bacterium]MDB5678965.1 zinc metalloprotease [Sphingomonas bacterium]
MRLDDFDPNINVEDQRGSGGGSGFGGFGGGSGGGGLLFAFLPMIFSRFGVFGVAVVLGIFLFFGGGLQMLGGGGSQVAGSSAPTETRRAGSDTASSCTLDAGSKVACNAFSSADKTWAAIFAKQGKQFDQPKLVFYDGNGQSGCGAAQSAMGPFYCPQDQGVYLDTSFFQELVQKFGASGDFAQDYVIAHEFGHHIQNLLGTSDRVSSLQRRASATDGNRLSVMLELQADCFAGVWAAQNRARMDPDDLAEGMTAAKAIGDDTLQREMQGRVVPDSFTHGTSEQRMTWLKRGIDSGDYRQCDTFAGALN